MSELGVSSVRSQSGVWGMGDVVWYMQNDDFCRRMYIEMIY